MEADSLKIISGHYEPLRCARQQAVLPSRPSFPARKPLVQIAQWSYQARNTIQRRLRKL